MNQLTDQQSAFIHGAMMLALLKSDHYQEACAVGSYYHYCNNVRADVQMCSILIIIIYTVSFLFARSKCFGRERGRVSCENYLFKEHIIVTILQPIPPSFKVKFVLKNKEKKQL